jgi:nitrogen fixation/metabolism regulation signal transduction histidine kinase
MIKKLSKSITKVNAAAFVAVILVGAVSIFFTQNILHNAYKIQTISEDIVLTDSIHSDIYTLIRETHHFLLEEDDLSSKEALRLISELEKKVTDYKNHEMTEEHAGENLEIAQLDIILSSIKKLYAVNEIIAEFKETGAYNHNDLIELEEYSYTIEETADEINKIHMNKIQRWINESLNNMWKIMGIYLFFIFLGGLTIFAGHRALIKKIASPIKELASATMEFAEGKLGKRVQTNSETEIGLLYNSFNEMAEKLQKNDEFLRKFNEELEQRVNERTYELQMTNQHLRNTRNALIRTEKAAAIGQIAAGVTHEIKNPLNSLAINTQMLMKELSDKFGGDSSVHESASLIKYEVNRINNILEEFVKFAKFPEPQYFENNINQVIQETADFISDSAASANVAIKLNLHDDIPGFMLDARQFKEVILNLAQNAIKAMKDGGELEMKTDMKDGNVVIYVTDTGEGILEKNLQSIFKPFYSTRAGGLGLGLPIVQRIVESHGGEIYCTSVPGEKTVFEIVLPLERG